LETGIFGLLAFIWLLTTIIKISFKAISHDSSPLMTVLANTVLCIILSLSVAAFAHDVFKPVIPNELLWVMVALLCALIRIEKDPSLKVVS